jgi:hypothetical protein
MTQIELRRFIEVEAPHLTETDPGYNKLVALEVKARHQSNTGVKSEIAGVNVDTKTVVLQQEIEE